MDVIATANPFANPLNIFANRPICCCMLRRYESQGNRMNRLKAYVFDWREPAIEDIYSNVSQERRTENEGQSSIEALLQQNQELLKQNAELIEEINRLLENGKRRHSKENRPPLDDNQEFMIGL